MPCVEQSAPRCADAVVANLVGNVIHHDRRRRPPVVHGRKAAVSLLPGRIPNLEFYGRVIELHLLRKECRCGNPKQGRKRGYVGAGGGGGDNQGPGKPEGSLR